MTAGVGQYLYEVFRVLGMWFKSYGGTKHGSFGLAACGSTGLNNGYLAKLSVTILDHKCSEVYKYMGFFSV